MMIPKGGIPSQYIVADYIVMATNQYINTGISAIPRYTRSIFEVYWNGSTTGTRGLYGVRAATSADYRSYCVFLVVGGSGPRWDNCGTSSLSSNWSTGEWHTVELTHSGNYGQVVDNGIIVATGDTNMSTSEYASIHLNTIYTNGNVNTGGTMRWKSVKIWQDGVNLSADMIPVYDTVTQAGGMYDMYRQIFIGGSNPGGNTITAYDAEGNIITG